MNIYPLPREQLEVLNFANLYNTVMMEERK